MNATLRMTGLILAIIMLVGDARGGSVAEKKTLTLDGARKVMAAAVAEAKKAAHPTGAIAIVDDGGHVMLVERLDGTFAAGANISVGKARTAALFKKPTRVFEELINKSRTAMTTLNDFTPLQGGVPITIDGQVVGAIGVSGAASAQADDDIATTAAAALDSATAQTTRPVSFFAHDVVASAFGRGAVLTDGNGANYQVHASRRDAPGVAEVHSRETDIIYVISGEANFVTGGTVVDGKAVADDEIRGPSIDGGEERRITSGDVIIVPAGVPHWFKSVRGTIEYYVVKVS